MTRTARWTLALLALALGHPTASPAQDTCDVTVALADAGPVVLLAYGLDYSAAGGSFMGSGFTPTCTVLPGWVATQVHPTVYDDDVALLSEFVASDPGVVAPQALLSCVFALAGGFPCPAPSAFVVTDPVFPDLGGIGLDDIFPDLPPPPAVGITVTPRTPVCGDAIQEGTEACDDGNTADGDCCSSTCTLDAAGTPCSDGTVCTTGDTCDAAGACVPDATVVCAEDGDPCTTESCDAVLGCASALVPAPPSRCYYGRKAAIDLRHGATPEKSKLMWQLASHGAIDPATIGDPTNDTDYALCIYDEVADVPSLAMRVDVPAGANWQTVVPGLRYHYKDATRSVNGVERLRVDGKPNGAKLQLKAAKEHLTLPGPVAPDRYFAIDDHLTAQLRNTAGGCWTVRLNGPKENGASRFKAKKP